jgi:hypothetical protein
MTYSWLCCLDCDFTFGEVRVSRTERHAHDLVRDAKRRVLSILTALRPEIHASPARVVIPFERWERTIKQFGDQTAGNTGKETHDEKNNQDANGA